MNEQQTERLLALLGAIADSLGRLAGERDGESAPDWEFPIESYAGFDWVSHGAQVIATDSDGPTVVQWGGKNFKRRSPDNAFDPAIWFSHCIGKTEDGRNEYVRLVTFRKFKEDDVQPLGRKAERYVAQPPPAATLPSTGSVRACTAPNPQNTPDAMAQMFDGLPSASAELPPYTPPAPQIGPKVSQGAVPDTATRGHGDTGAKPANGSARRSATLGVGKVGGEFRNWAQGFAARNPQYWIGRTEDVDMYHILMSVGSFGIERIENENLAEVIALLEDHVRAPAPVPA